MKKVILSTMVLGAVLSVSSAFAEDVQIQAVTASGAPVAVLYDAPVAVSTAAAVTADVVVPASPEVTSVLPVIEKAEVATSLRLDVMKARGAQLIKERVNSLNANAQAIANSKVLSADQKSAFAQFFTGKILELNTLGTKIASSTDATTTKSLISSIYTDFRIYGVLIPQLRLEKRLYELQAHATKLGDTFVKVQARITEFKNKGKDVTVWQKNLDDAKALVAADSAKIPALLIKINSLQPVNYGTTSKTVIESVNKDTKAIARDFESINRKVMRPSHLMNMKGWKMGGEVHTSTTTVR